MAYDDIAGRPVAPSPPRRDSHAQHMHAPAKRPARLGVSGSFRSRPMNGDLPRYRPTKRRNGYGAIVPEGMPTTAMDADWQAQILALREALMALGTPSYRRFGTYDPLALMRR